MELAVKPENQNRNRGEKIGAKLSWLNAENAAGFIDAEAERAARKYKVEFDANQQEIGFLEAVFFREWGEFRML